MTTSIPTTSLPVLLEREGAIARIRFNRPEVLNAADRALALAFRDWRSSPLAEGRTFSRLASRTRLRGLLAREREGLARELEALRAER